MDFGEAFKHLMAGERIAMIEWSPGTFLMKRQITPGVEIVELYVDHGSRRITWSPSQRELLNQFWMIAPKPGPKVIEVEGTNFFTTGK